MDHNILIASLIIDKESPNKSEYHLTEDEYEFIMAYRAASPIDKIIIGYVLDKYSTKKIYQ